MSIGEREMMRRAISRDARCPLLIHYVSVRASQRNGVHKETLRMCLQLEIVHAKWIHTGLVCVYLGIISRRLISDE